MSETANRARDEAWTRALWAALETTQTLTHELLRGDEDALAWARGCLPEARALIEPFNEARADALARLWVVALVWGWLELPERRPAIVVGISEDEVFKFDPRSWGHAPGSAAETFELALARRWHGEVFHGGPHIADGTLPEGEVYKNPPFGLRGWPGRAC